MTAQGFDLIRDMPASLRRGRLDCGEAPQQPDKSATRQIEGAEHGEERDRS